MKEDFVIDVKNLSIEFITHEGVVKAVNNLSYKIKPSQTLGIVGESGSGKSVSSMGIMDLLPKPPAVISPQSSVKLLGRELIGLNRRETRHMRGNIMSMIFQDPMTCLNPYRRIDHQMIEGLLYHQKISQKAALFKAQKMLEYVQIPEAERRLKNYPHELSGGMRQRVMIAMAMLTDPKLLFADEPTTALDVTVQAQIMQLFKNIRAEFQTAIVLISHNLGVIATQCENILVMYAGQMMEYGSPEKIFEKTAHPYTMALKKSIPDLYPKESETKILHTIKGNPPNLMQLESGCPFLKRCDFAKAECTGNIPVKQIGADHYSRCLL
ncbi:MAG: ABC transporter ATP-binding protein [Bacteriovoracaceae bacterium]|nr:ABC transporter ATP-binding protein [Bacteriovoracaceae bacterium]